jgi:hypothetical protein
VAYDKVISKWVQNPVGVQLQTQHLGLVAYQAIHPENISVLTNYWNFIKMGDNSHIGRRVHTILER